MEQLKGYTMYTYVLPVVVESEEPLDITKLQEKLADRVFASSSDEFTTRLDDIEPLGFQKCPWLAVDMVIVINGQVVIAKRKNPPHGWALPGGFVDRGETVEVAALRETKEETGIDLYDVEALDLIGVYSRPDRDHRGHIVSVAYIASAEGVPVASDDVSEVKLIPWAEIIEGQHKIIADHNEILLDAYEKFVEIQG